MSDPHYDRISDDEWVWISRQNRERAERELEEAKKQEEEARRRVSR